ncbi:putative ArsR family transcriptional regulator [Kitasatospora herbaricolor]|uniref:helix-turn-helix transcriptional regulator n=1 Tax=Kitasatospora herbaricolor TaxID=68217 RepID=UPI001749ACA3|nr:helix-turn-helix domain-containing protein [Kitasatospora herbaricolor]MDQ0307306.1 putative ArsR family transcriptional regulator [Kitasatospora herbaricolor]
MDSSDPGVHKALSAPARRALLATLTEASGPLDIEQLAGALDLHVTTVRHHLTAMVEAGLVEVRRAGPVTGRGRPRLRYAAAPAREQLAAYRALVEVLSLGYGADPAERSARAERAGRSWGGAAGDEQDQAGPILSDQVLAERVLAEAEGWGFGPELTAGGARVLLHNCPFQQNAESYPEVVCAVHQGMLDAIAERAGRPGGLILRPFSAPGVCSIDVARAEPAPPPAA